MRNILNIWVIICFLFNFEYHAPGVKVTVPHYKMISVLHSIESWLVVSVFKMFLKHIFVSWQHLQVRIIEVQVIEVQV